MKKSITILLAGIILLNFSSCSEDGPRYSYSIRDALKISAWVLDETLDERGYWIEKDSGMGIGYWVENDGRIVDSAEDDIFVFERLELDKVRTMAPIHYMSMLHINIFCEFDGIIEIEPEDEYILLHRDAKNPSQPIRGGDAVGVVDGNIRWVRELCVNVCPLDKYTLGAQGIIRDAAQIGNEYYLNINAYKYENENSPIIRATLKLTVIEDKSLSPDYEDIFGIPRGESSRFLSIELISYEYNEIRALLDDIWDDEEYN